MGSPTDLTGLLHAAAGGDPDAFGNVVAAVYDELRAIARRQRAGEGRDHTLDTTGIVHEAYVKLVRLDRLQWQNRSQFYAIAARAMRQVLLDHARKRRAEKRGGGVEARPLDEADEVPLVSEERADELIELDSALQDLEALNPRHARIVECRFFLDLSIDETARALGISPATVKRDWTVSRAWLNRELTRRGSTK